MSQKNGTTKKAAPVPDKAAYERAIAEDRERRSKQAGEAIQEALKKYNCALHAEPIFRPVPGGLYAVSGQVRVVAR